MAELPKRRPLLGKKLLVVAGMAAISQLDCSSTTVANLVAPPEDAAVDTDVAADRPDATDIVTPRDDGTMLRDVPVANLVPPPDVVRPTDDGATMRDVPVANLIPPPEDVVDVPAPQDDGVSIRDVPVANLIPPPEDVVQPTDNGVTLRDIPVANLIAPPPDANN